MCLMPKIKTNEMLDLSTRSNKPVAIHTSILLAMYLYLKLPKIRNILQLTLFGEDLRTLFLKGIGVFS